MKSQDEENPLLRVALAVSDGQPVDWDSQRKLQEDAAGELAHLRVLEALASAHREAIPHRPTSQGPAAGASDPQQGNPPRSEPTPALRTGPATSRTPGASHPRRWLMVALALLALWIILRFMA